MDDVFFEELETGTHIQCPKELVGIRIGGVFAKETNKDANSSRSLTRRWRKLLLPLLMLGRLFVATALLAWIIHKDLRNCRSSSQGRCLMVLVTNGDSGTWETESTSGPKTLNLPATERILSVDECLSILMAGKLVKGKKNLKRQAVVGTILGLAQPENPNNRSSGASGVRLIMYLAVLTGGFLAGASKVWGPVVDDLTASKTEFVMV
jgi:hypothetical protein